jgi:hypothetical protein
MVVFGPYAKSGEKKPGFGPRCNTWLVVEFDGKNAKIQTPQQPNTRKLVICPNPNCKRKWEAWITEDGMLSKVYGATIQSIGGAPEVSCDTCGQWSKYNP